MLDKFDRLKLHSCTRGRPWPSVYGRPHTRTYVTMDVRARVLIRTNRVRLDFCVTLRDFCCSGTHSHTVPSSSTDGHAHLQVNFSIVLDYCNVTLPSTDAGRAHPLTSARIYVYGQRRPWPSASVRMQLRAGAYT